VDLPPHHSTQINNGLEHTDYNCSFAQVQMLLIAPAESEIIANSLLWIMFLASCGSDDASLGDCNGYHKTDHKKTRQERVEKPIVFAGN
jgi:hypothetical protein